MRVRKTLSGLLVALFLTVSTSAPALAIDLGDIIGVVGGGLLVKAIADPINDFINTITLNKGVKVEGHTKVVPIVTVGSGTSIGAAQVAGPKGVIDRTKAVAQLDLSFQGRIGVKVLVPIDSENPLQRFRRVQGVGVSAIIDYRL